MPACVGVGVAMPFPVGVEEDLIVGVAVIVGGDTREGSLVCVLGWLVDRKDMDT